MIEDYNGKFILKGYFDVPQPSTTVDGHLNGQWGELDSKAI